jgi:hypothetical protein
MLAHFFLWHLKLKWGKKAPALTVAQLRLFLAVVLPWRTYRSADVLEIIAWRQRCNHRAYRSQRKRRETEGCIIRVQGMAGRRRARRYGA